MDAWYSSLAAETNLAPPALRNLQREGFIVIPGPVPKARFAQLAEAYDRQMLTARGDDAKAGTSTIRVKDFVNRGEAFDDLYLHPPLLDACCRILQQPFKLSTMHARTLRPRSVAQGLHMDFRGDERGWPMVGFIFMIDDFRVDNGATRFVSCSQNAESPPAEAETVPACGPAGSMIVFNGSVWHGHGANDTDEPRRSIQGAYIRRTETAWDNLAARMRPETLDRISPLAKYLLAL